MCQYCGSELDEPCGAVTDIDGYLIYCTRPKDHSGPHIACTVTEHNILGWFRVPVGPGCDPRFS